MKKFLMMCMAIASLVWVTGCGEKQLKEKLVGKWTRTVEKTGAVFTFEVTNEGSAYYGLVGRRQMDYTLETTGDNHFKLLSSGKVEMTFDVHSISNTELDVTCEDFVGTVIEQKWTRI